MLIHEALIHLDSFDIEARQEFYVVKHKEDYYAVTIENNVGKTVTCRIVSRDLKNIGLIYKDINEVFILNLRIKATSEDYGYLYLPQFMIPLIVDLNLINTKLYCDTFLNVIYFKNPKIDNIFRIYSKNLPNLSYITFINIIIEYDLDLQTIQDNYQKLVNDQQQLKLCFK